MTSTPQTATIAVASTKRIIEGKRCIVTSVTKADRYRVGDAWHNAVGIEHDTPADEVTHFNRHTSVKGATVHVNPLLDEPSIDVQILSIRAVDPRRLSPETFTQLGYIDYDDYMADWGRVFGDRVWLMAIKPVTTKVPGNGRR